MSKVQATPSSNWLSLKKQLNADRKPSTRGEDRTRHQHQHRNKRKMLERSSSSSTQPPNLASSSALPSGESAMSHASNPVSLKHGGSIAALQQMVLGHIEYTEGQKTPGKYLALDCEMVGVGIDGQESSLARVSFVNFYGFIIMDEFVQQKERVVDYRTQWSGIRDSDMIHAKPFEEVQKRVAELLTDAILVGHAVHNDLKALLLSHSRGKTRDTQIYAHKFGLVKSKRAALRNLVKQELDLTIQDGEHSSVTDARATMAVYRLHKKDWEKGTRPLPTSSKTPVASASSPLVVASTSKRKRVDIESDSDSESDDPPPAPESIPRPPKRNGKEKAVAQAAFPGGGRKGVSSGLSTVIRRKGDKSHVSGGKGGDLPGASASSGKSDWWKQLPGSNLPGSSSSAKGSIRVGVQR